MCAEGPVSSMASSCLSWTKKSSTRRGRGDTITLGDEKALWKHFWRGASHRTNNGVVVDRLLLGLVASYEDFP